jgi:hypothetical protein
MHLCRHIHACVATRVITRGSSSFGLHNNSSSRHYGLSSKMHAKSCEQRSAWSQACPSTWASSLCSAEVATPLAAFGVVPSTAPVDVLPAALDTQFLATVLCIFLWPVSLKLSSVRAEVKEPQGVIVWVTSLALLCCNIRSPI